MRKMRKRKTEKDIEEKEEISLRSEEVQEIMGRVPSWIERWGMTAIGVMLAVILLSAAYFPYPDTLVGSFRFIPADTTYVNKQECYALLPVQGIGKVKKGQSVKIRLANYPDNEFGYLTGEVLDVADISDDTGLYKVYVRLAPEMKTSTGYIVPVNAQMEGTAEIIVAEKRLIEKLRLF